MKKLKWVRVRAAVETLALAALAAAGTWAQQTSQPSQSPTLKTGITYTDQYSADCEKTRSRTSGSS